MKTSIVELLMHIKINHEMWLNMENLYANMTSITQIVELFDSPLSGRIMLSLSKVIIEFFFLYQLFTIDFHTLEPLLHGALCECLFNWGSSHYCLVDTWLETLWT